MTDRLRIALAQLNPKVGDLSGNLALGRDTLADAAAAGADILMFPELFLTGYFPDDLLHKPQFVDDAIAAATQLAAATAGTSVSLVLPTVWRDEEGLRNAIILAEAGEIVARRFKRELPNNDVFHEKRYFVAGELAEPLTIKGVSIGVPICEDIWHSQVCGHLVDNGARMLLCPNGSPYWRMKQDTSARNWCVPASAKTTCRCSTSTRSAGRTSSSTTGPPSRSSRGTGWCCRAPRSKPELIVSDWSRTDRRLALRRRPEVKPLTSVEETPWRACVLGLRDYVHKNGFSSVAARPFRRHRFGRGGGHRCRCASAPTRCTASCCPTATRRRKALRDAKECAERLGVRYDIVSIGAPVDETLV